MTQDRERKWTGRSIVALISERKLHVRAKEPLLFFRLCSDFFPLIFFVYQGRRGGWQSLTSFIIILGIYFNTACWMIVWLKQHFIIRLMTKSVIPLWLNWISVYFILKRYLHYNKDIKSKINPPYITAHELKVQQIYNVRWENIAFLQKQHEIIHLKLLRQ